MVHHRLRHRPDDILSLAVDDRSDLFVDQNLDTGIDGSDDRHVVHQIDLGLHCAGADSYNIIHIHIWLMWPHNTKRNKAKQKEKEKMQIESIFYSKQFCYEIVLSVSPFGIYVARNAANANSTYDSINE